MALQHFGARHGVCGVGLGINPVTMSKTMDPEKIEKLVDKNALRNLMENAKRLERDDVYWLAFKRLCSLEAQFVTAAYTCR